MKPSTTDYNGIYRGYYIDFEAKETKNKTGFPISNIHNHQIKHIRNIVNESGICFLIIRFTTLDKTYLLKAKDFLDYIDSNKKSNDAKRERIERLFIYKGDVDGNQT